MCKNISISVKDLEFKRDLREIKVIASDDLYILFGECSCCLDTNDRMKKYVMDRVGDALNYLIDSGYVGNVIVEVL